MMPESGLSQPRGNHLIGFLKSRNLTQPDGRPLYAYEINDDELKSLKNHLANTNSLDQAAEVVLYGSWFYCRYWKEGRASYDSLIDHLQLAKSAQIASLVRRGLQFWKVRICEAGGKDQLLYSMIYSGGFPPVQLLNPNPLRRFVLRLLQRMETLGSEWQYLQELVFAEESGNLPISMRQPEFHLRLNELAQAIHSGVNDELSGQPETTTQKVLQKLKYPSIQQDTLLELLKSLIETHRIYVSRISLSLRLKVEFDTVKLDFILKMPSTLSNPRILQAARECKRSLPLYLNQQVIAHLRVSGNKLVVDRYYEGHPEFRFQSINISVRIPEDPMAEELCSFPQLNQELPLVFLQGMENWTYSGQKNIIKTRRSAVLLVFQGIVPNLPVPVRSQLIADRQCHWAIFNENWDFVWNGIPFLIQVNAEKEESEGYILSPSPEDLTTSLPVYSTWPELHTSHKVKPEDLALCRGNESQYIPYSETNQTSGLYRLYLKSSNASELRRFIYWPDIRDMEWSINSENQLAVQIPRPGIKQVESLEDKQARIEVQQQFIEAKIPLTLSTEKIWLRLHLLDSQYFDLTIPAWHPEALVREKTTKRIFRKAWDYLAHAILADLEFLNHQRQPSEVRIKISLPVHGFDVVHLSTRENGLETAAQISGVIAANQFYKRSHLQLNFMIQETSDKGEVTICGSDMNLELNYQDKTIQIKDGAWLTMPENEKKLMKVFCIRLDTSEESVKELPVQAGSASFADQPPGIYMVTGILHGQTRADFPDPLVIGPETNPDESLASLMNCYPLHKHQLKLHKRMFELLDNPSDPDWLTVENCVQAMRIGPACSIPWVRAMEADWDNFCVAYLVFRSRFTDASLLERATPVCFATISKDLWWQYLQKLRNRTYPLLKQLSEAQQHQVLRTLLNELFRNLSLAFPWLSDLRREARYRMPETFAHTKVEEDNTQAVPSLEKVPLNVKFNQSRIHCAQIIHAVRGDKGLRSLLPALDLLTSHNPALQSYYYAAAFLAGAHFYGQYDQLLPDMVVAVKVLRSICPEDFDRRIQSGINILRTTSQDRG